MLVRLFALILILAPAAARAGNVSLDVRGVDGRGLAGAVVTLVLPGVAAPVPRESYAMEQRDIQFQPHVLIVPVGASVSFPNRDKVRHHVYSFSKPKKIDLKLYGRDESRSVVFDKPGVVALGCNIHDAMNGFIIVSATPFAAQTDANGHVEFANVPAGAAKVSVWHPSIRAPGNVATQPLAVAAGGGSKIFAITR